MRTASKQHGFSILEVLVIIVAIGTIGAAGWYVYQHDRTKPVNAAAGNQQATSQSDTTTPSANKNIIKITELGIQITVPDDLKDLTYRIGNSGTFKNGQKGIDASFSTKSLTNVDAKCGTDYSPLGVLTRGEGSYPSDDPAVAVDYGGNLVKQFSTFFISYTGPQAGCSSNSTTLNTMSKFKHEFQAALPDMQTLN